jgi:hypothetical protein
VLARINQESGKSFLEPENSAKAVCEDLIKDPSGRDSIQGAWSARLKPRIVENNKDQAA